MTVLPNRLDCGTPHTGIYYSPEPADGSRVPGYCCSEEEMEDSEVNIFAPDTTLTKSVNGIQPE